MPERIPSAAVPASRISSRRKKQAPQDLPIFDFPFPSPQEEPMRTLGNSSVKSVHRIFPKGGWAMKWKDALPAWLGMEETPPGFH